MLNHATSVGLQSLPGPGRAPTSLIRFLFDPYGFYDANRQRFGDRFTMPVPPGMAALFTSRPDDLRTILSAPTSVFERRTTALVDLLGHNTILTLDGLPHAERRRIVGPCLSGPRLDKLAARMLNAAHHRLDQWHLGQGLQLFREMSTITMDVMCGAVFGFNLDHHQFSTFRGHITETMNRVSIALLASKTLRRAWGPFSPWSKYSRAKAATDEAIADEIKRTRGRAARSDILSFLSNVTDKEGRPLESETIAAELYGFLLVSYENVANHLTWGLYLLCEHPDVRERLHAELDELDEQDEDYAAALIRLPYLDAVIREVLRILPPSETFRKLAQPFALDGLDLNTGDLLIPSIYMAHTDPERYPDPYTFWPERWLDGYAADGAFDFLPFGGGTRRCIAQAFAMVELKMVLVSVLRRAQLTLAPAQHVRPRRRRLATMAHNGVLARVEALTPRPGSRVRHSRAA